MTSELIAETISTFTKSRLTRVVKGDEPGGITTETVRVEADGVALPEDITPTEAQEFNRLLNKFTEDLDGLDKDTLKAIWAATKTRDATTTMWHGGGGFTHLEVGPSMFEEAEGMVLLADWATRGDLAKAMCAQLEAHYKPDGIFAAKRGKVRYVVIDGLVGESTVRSVLDQLGEGQIVEIWGTQYDDAAADLLRTKRPGSRLEAIPDSVLDRYRRKAAKGSPFKREETTR